MVAEMAQSIIESLEQDGRTSELAAIAGYLHDIGNTINRNGHGEVSGLMAYTLLNEMGMPAEEYAEQSRYRKYSFPNTFSRK
jgi:HD superfamily phosphodiesterase